MSSCYHFIGVGGIGMSALARILLQKGLKVRGSDNTHSQIIQELKDLGAEIFLGHDFSHVLPESIVVYSSDIKRDNPEMLAAEEYHLKMLHRSELLRDVMSGFCPLLVTGTHGKTTTSSLLSHVLMQGGVNPTFAVGGMIKNYATNSRFENGKYFVAEADESDGSFLAYPSYGAIVTNIDLDHLNYWQTESSLVEGFQKFCKQVSNPQLLIWCSDDDRLSQMQLPGVSYGFSINANARLKDFHQDGFFLSFSLCWNGMEYKNIEVSLIGKHNALNAAAVFIMAIQIGVAETAVRDAFKNFEGVGRRADKVGQLGSVCFYDDYGHHPTEIKATLLAFKQSHPQRRLITVFQPHRYTRTKDCMDEFPDAFSSADVVILTDIYAAGEPPIEGIDSEKVYTKIINRNIAGQVYYMKKTAIDAFLFPFLKDNDVVVTMGAGDITKFGTSFIQKFMNS
jgi:UDP-N-acetylmuramate--alanine ligase